MDPERALEKGRGRNARYRYPTTSKGFNKRIREFEAAMASDKQETEYKKKRGDEASPKQTKTLEELDEKGEFLKSIIRSEDVHSNLRKEDDHDPDCRHEGRWEPVEPCHLPEPMYRSGNQAEPSAKPTTGDQPRIDFQRYQDIIEKITVNDTLPDDPKEVNIKFEDETLQGARVAISKNGDKVKIRWQTDSGSVYRMLTKQRFQLQQQVYGHLGIKSEVSVDFKKKLKPQFAQQKTLAGRRSLKNIPVDAKSTK
jgi:hypothetical protein